MTSSLELLEHLTHLVNCEYISDLRCRATDAAVGEALRSVARTDFPDEQWQETAHYLLGADCTRRSAENCRQLLLEHYPVLGEK